MNKEENILSKSADVKSPAKTKWMQIIILILSGLVIGALNGFFGGGGGMLVVPVLSLVLKMEEKNSHATAIAVIFPLCLISGIVYLVKGAFNLHVGGPSSIGIIIGGVIGAMLLSKLSNNFLKFLFYGVMLAAGIKMVI